MSTRQRAGGQIQPHQRNADFDGKLLGENIVLEEPHIEEVQAVEQFSLDEDTKKNTKTSSSTSATTGSSLFQIISGLV